VVTIRQKNEKMFLQNIEKANEWELVFKIKIGLLKTCLFFTSLNGLNAWKIQSLGAALNGNKYS